MKLKRSRGLVVLFTVVMLGVMTLTVPVATAKEKEKEKESADQPIDAGSFGVFMNGHRVGTETFAIVQNRGGSLIKSQFKTMNGPNGVEAVQSSELQLSGNGEIRRYDWKELSPDQASSTVTLNDQFLNQKWNTGPQTKEENQPYLLPATTSILDDYFFVHREVLVWKFLGASCRQGDKGQLECPIKQRAQFGTLNPRQHASSPLSAEYMGREKINFKGEQREFNKIELKNDAGVWQLWLDDQFKLMRIWIEGDNTEVLRD